MLQYLCELFEKILDTGVTAFRRGITYYSYELLVCTTFMYRHAGTISFLSNIHVSVSLNICAFFLRFLRITWVYFFFALRGFPSPGKMAGIVNSSQHCYFNSLLQCLGNSSRIYDYLDEHEREIRNVVGECFLSFTLFIRHLGILIVSPAFLLKHRSTYAELRCALHRQ